MNEYYLLQDSKLNIVTRMGANISFKVHILHKT